MLLQEHKQLFEQNTQIKAIFRNGQRVWPATTGSTPPGPDYSEPFYVENINNENETLSIVKNSPNAPTLIIEYSTDRTTWKILGTTSDTALTRTLTSGEKVYLRCNTNVWSLNNTYNNITGISKVGGNVMSLLYGSSFTGQETSFPSTNNHAFYGLFDPGSVNTSILQNASDLLLPATTLTPLCYSTMFQRCTSLTTAPALPATTLAQACYSNMFNRCNLLTTAPALPATTLASNCYSNMFSGCTSLTTAPALPATTLENSCYSQMFTGCTSLTTAPVLSATTLIQRCYDRMFRNCTLLSNITCLATSYINTNYSTNNWLQNISSSGIFTKAAGVEWPTGASGIPSSWTVIEV